MSTTYTSSVTQLARALEIAQQIEQLETELRGVLGGAVSTASAPVSVAAAPAPAAKAPVAKASGKKGKRTVSPEARAKMAAAQSARWAAYRAAKGK